MSEGDRGSSSDVFVPEVQNESKDLWRESVDRGEPISPVLGEAEDFESSLFENMDLKEGTRE